MSFVFGFIAGAVLLGLLWFFDKKQVKFIWYEWLIGALAYAFLLIAIGWGSDALAEGESQSGLMFFLIFGLLAVVLGMVTWQLYRVRIAKAA